MNVHNFKRVMKAIAAAPEWQTEMDSWHGWSPCGTTHCIAGWCEIICGERVPLDDLPGLALRFLGLSDNYRSKLFVRYHWPEPFRSDYEQNPKAATLARLQHFISTEGRE